MNTLICLIRERMEKRRQYFDGATKEIAAKNLQLLKILSLVTAGLLLFFFALTPFIIEGWTITPQHFFFLPAALLLHFLALLYEKKGSCRRQAVNGLCLLFQAVLFIFAILIDVLSSSPDVPSSFMPVLFIALPALFILPFRQVYLVSLLFEVIYSSAVFTYKTPFIAQYDIFDSVVGIVFSIAVGEIITQLRIRDHEIRMKYKLLSTQDALSGGLNKKAFEDAVKEYLRAYCPSVTCAFLILDIDSFKDVNDHLGHYTGDALLRSTGELLLETFRSTDIIGRFGGDEFVVLIKGFSSIPALKGKCHTLQDKLLNSLTADSSLFPTCSIGGILVNGQAADFETMFRQADDALYKAKDAGKNCYILHPYHSA